MGAVWLSENFLFAGFLNDIFIKISWSFIIMISKNDFTCKCGCGKNLIKDEIVSICEEINRQVGMPLTINSGFRCAVHNSKIGGETNSQHVLGNAADITCSSMSKLKEVCKSMWSINKIGGIGLYTNFVHVDKGPHRSWTR